MARDAEFPKPTQKLLRAPNTNVLSPEGSAETLGDLIHHLRNAVAHRRVWFSSDRHEPRDVEVEFADAKSKMSPVHWQVRIICGYRGKDVKVTIETATRMVPADLSGWGLTPISIRPKRNSSCPTSDGRPIYLRNRPPGLFPAPSSRTQQHYSIVN